MASPAFGGANVANCPRPTSVASSGLNSSPATSARMSSVLQFALSCGAERDQHPDTHRKPTRSEDTERRASALTAALNSQQLARDGRQPPEPLRAEVVFELVGEGVSARLIHL